jgi:hypothetical protein
MKITAVLSGAIFLAFAHTAGAQIIAQHSGSTNPGTEGFKNSEGGYPVFGSPVTSAWNMDQYAWTDDYNQYTFTPAQSAALWTEPWTLTAIMQNLSTGTGFGSGIYADVLANGRFDIDLSSDGAGDQLLSNNGNYATGMVAQPSYTIAGLGTNYATFQMVYNPTSHTADYYVNGTLALSNSSGLGSCVECAPQPGAVVLFGGVDGNFKLVSLQFGDGDTPTRLCFLLKNVLYQGQQF